MTARPQLYIIGGANGSGKTTAAMTLLPRHLDIFEFVNADEIAKGLNPLKPETANIMSGRMMIERIDNLLDARTSFAFETTCAGHHHVATIEKAKKLGYHVTLVFLWLPSAEMAVERVKTRVTQGGHDIPHDTIHRRYRAGLVNLVRVFLPIVDAATILDATHPVTGGRLFAQIAKKEEKILHIVNGEKWRIITSEADHDNQT